MKRAHSPTSDAIICPKEDKLMKTDTTSSIQQLQQLQQLQQIIYIGSWDVLPLEIQIKIFSFLSLRSSYLLVSKVWNSLFLKTCTSLNLVRYCDQITDDVINHLTVNCPLVQKLTLGKIGVHLPITDKGIAHLSRFKKLKSLNFIACNLSPSTIKFLSEQLTQLISLNMTWCSISDTCVEHIPLFVSLKHLSLQDSRITDCGLAKLENLRYLNSLNLSFCSNITDRGIIYAVKYLKNIESLNLSWCAEITDLSLQHIGTHLGRLRFLFLTGCRKISMDGKNFIRRNLVDCKVYSDSNFIPFKRQFNM